MTYVNRWAERPFHLPDMACDKAEEHCVKCGRLMVESIERTGLKSRTTGLPEEARWHSCPTWTDRSLLHRLRSFSTPGYGHDSHDADNPLMSRGYR